MNAKCPECGKKLIAYRLIRHNNQLMEEERDVIIENENCLRIFKPNGAINNSKPFNVYCIDSNCSYGIKDCMDVLQANRLGELTISGNMRYTMGRE